MPTYDYNVYGPELKEIVEYSEKEKKEGRKTTSETEKGDQKFIFSCVIKHETNYECKICKKKYSLENDVIQHIREKHNEDNIKNYPITLYIHAIEEKDPEDLDAYAKTPEATTSDQKTEGKKFHGFYNTGRYLQKVLTSMSESGEIKFLYEHFDRIVSAEQYRILDEWPLKMMRKGILFSVMNSKLDRVEKAKSIAKEILAIKGGHIEVVRIIRHKYGNEVSKYSR